MRYLILPLILLLFFTLLAGESTMPDSTRAWRSLYAKTKPYIIPTILISYGAAGVKSDKLEFYNFEIREELQENIDDKFTIDDISQYAPFVSVYVLNAIGIEGQHRFRDRTFVLGTAYALMGGTVLGLKRITREKRPDSSSRNSFPSGHTATAFMGAEFVYQEYKDVSPWYGVSAYVVAAGTGLFRLYNNRHWLTDVAAGAGIGMLSTKFAYLLLDSHQSIQCDVAPFLNTNSFGVAFNIMY